ncbi:MAG: histidine kinase [Rikenellaceae bacterium]
MILILNLLPLMLIYSVNNLLFIPKYLFRDRRAAFFVANIILLSLLLVFSYKYGRTDILRALGFDNVKAGPPKSDLTFLTRELINYILMVGFVTALQLMGRLQRSEEALKEAENARIKAELTNLKSQINPHFLLNTLNNIYALTAIDSEKAQKTIKELSLLLRYVLYENKSDKVLLVKEVEFLKNYIELMRIRLTANVRLNVECTLSEDSAAQIAPLIFISLIENAFKHGVDANKPSFIDIHIEHRADEREVILSIKNSNNAKRDNDKSGNGIGLDQVRRRLELQYEGAYEWDITESGELYESVLILKNVE